MDLAEYASLDATALSERLRERDVSAREVAETALRAHARVHARLNAVVETYDDVPDSLDRAAPPSGLFEGVPFLIKDARAHLAGRLVESGSRLGRGVVAEIDSCYVEMLRAAGIVFVGRSNAPEFSIAATTEGVLHGNCSNPWREGYSAGGSSGGAAAAVAAGVVPIAQGSDIGGSMRIPARSA